MELEKKADKIDNVKVYFFSKNTNITDFVRNYFLEKFSKTVQKIPENIRENAKIYFIYKKEGKSKSGEVIITTTKKTFPSIYTEEEGTDPRVIIDKLSEEIERQIDRFKTEFWKEIREEMQTKRGISIEPAEEKTEEEISFQEEPEIERIRVSIEKPMTVDDAIAIMKENEKKKSGRRIPVFVFNDFDGKIKIIFKQNEKKFLLFEVE